MAAGSQRALDTFCRAVIGSGVATQPIIVHSKSGLQPKADALAQCVITYIQGKGVTNPINPQCGERWPQTEVAVD